MRYQIYSKIKIGTGKKENTMKKILFLFMTIINFSIAQQPPPILQTILSPENELLLARAQMSPQTRSHSESHEQEIARLILNNRILNDEIKKLQLQIQSLEADLKQSNTLHLEKLTEIERLQQSLSNVLKISVKQKADINEKDDLLERATKEIAALIQQQEDHKTRLNQVIADGYKKLEQMKQAQLDRRILP